MYKKLVYSMSSSLVKCASQGNNSNSGGSSSHEERNEASGGLDLLHVTVPEATFLRAAISLKDQVVQATWEEVVKMKKKNDKGVVSKCDTSVYTGLLGTAFTCLRSYQATGNPHDLDLSAHILHSTASLPLPTSTRHVTFLCGRGGAYALGAVAANYQGDHTQRHFYLSRFLEVTQEKALPAGPEEGGLGMSYDLLYGRAGFLWAALYINKHIGPGTIPLHLLMPIVEAILAGGRAGATGTACPLMYRWHGTRYWGAAHGLAGVLQVVLQFPLSQDAMEDVKGTLRYMMSNRFPHSGNYPASEGNSRDKLVQWSHGATGIGMTLCKAAEVFPGDREFRDGAIEAGEVVWKSGLNGKIGLAEGVAGNAYAFLSLYRLTGDEVYVERTKAFSSFLYHSATKITTNNVSSDLRDHKYSLFYGLAGVACLWFDLVAPHSSRFPGYEI